MTKTIEAGTEVFGEVFRMRDGKRFVLDSLLATGAILRGDSDIEAKRAIRACYKRLHQDIEFVREDGEEPTSKQMDALARLEEEMRKRGMTL